MAIFDPNTNLYYKLVYEDPEHPILEISGIRMQEGNPVKTAQLKVSLLKARPGMKVLETCTGLGYCTYELVKRVGPGNVTSIEIDPNVLTLARELNHFKEIQGKYTQLEGDSFDYVKSFAEEGRLFDRILHDPPRFSRAPQLYSQEFYNNIYKILIPEGIFVHYVGNPFSKFRKKGFITGITRRLKQAGFKSIKREGYNLIIKK